MRGLLTLEPDDATEAFLRDVQNRLRNTLTRQGVHFNERLGPTLLSWPFATTDELLHAATLLHDLPLGRVTLETLHGRPNDDRPAEIGFGVSGAEGLQGALFRRLKAALDPDEPKSPYVRLVRIAPASRKVGTAFRGSGLVALPSNGFVPRGIALWNQTPTGFVLFRRVPLD